MPLYEYAGNLHIHTPYSDGTDYHAEIAAAAQRAGLDFIVVTDHNILVKGVEGYYGDAQDGHVLVLAGEEIHDRFRLPQVNHLLVYGLDEEFCRHAENPQNLINVVSKAGGLAFLAHPHDQQIPWQTPDADGIAIPWVDWQVSGYHGLEIWNYMSAFKDTAPNFRKALKSVFNPEDTMIGPRQETLDLWDKLLAEKKHVIGIGNADAHGTWMALGPIKHRIFPYDFLFNCVNTHILTSKPLTGDMSIDRGLIYSAVREGHAFIGYELPGNTRGFRYTAHCDDGTAMMGDTVRLGAGVTLQCKLPDRGRIKIICHSNVMSETDPNAEALTYTAREPGAYRVEVWKEFRGQERCWILSNPVYVIA